MSDEEFTRILKTEAFKYDTIMADILNRKLGTKKGLPPGVANKITDAVVEVFMTGMIAGISLAETNPDVMEFDND